MSSFTTSIAIDRAPEQVFAVLDDLEAARRWMPSIRRIVILTPGEPMGVGFKWRETRRLFGVFRMSLVLAIVEHERPTSWGLAFDDGKTRAVATFRIERAGRGSAVTFTEEVTDQTGRPERAETMLKRMHKQDGDLLERLRAYVESTTEPPALAPSQAGSKPNEQRTRAVKPKATAKPKTSAKQAAKKAK